MDISVNAFRQHLEVFRPANTVRSYVTGAEKLIRFVRDRRIDVRTAPGLLCDFSAWLYEQGFSPSTLGSVLPAARKYLEWCRSKGVRLPVFAKPELPRQVRHVPVALREGALLAFRHIVGQEKEPYRTALVLLPLCGLRASEMCNLRLSQVKTAGNRFVFKQVTGKSKQARDVPLVDPGSAYLYEYLTGWRGRSGIDTAWLFPAPFTGNYSKSISYQTLRKRLRKAAVQIGHPNLHLHHLRSTWVTLLVENGVEITEVAQMAGHESIETTMLYRAPAETEKLASAIQGVRGYDR